MNSGLLKSSPISQNRMGYLGSQMSPIRSGHYLLTLAHGVAVAAAPLSQQQQRERERAFVVQLSAWLLFVVCIIQVSTFVPCVLCVFRVRSGFRYQ